jgi:hypothetical protein
MTARRLPLLLLGLASASVAFGQVSITSASPLPQGFSEIAYTYTFTAVTSPANAPVTWSVPTSSAANLPTGFTLSPNGTFSGTTQQFGTFVFQVTATTGNFSDTENFSLVLLSPFITITSPSTLTSGFVGQSYSLGLSATSNPAGLQWSLSRGSQLPPGLSMNTAGLISGNPTTSGTFSFQVIAQIANTSISTTQPFSLTIYGGQATIQTTSLPFVFRGQPYSTTLNATPAAVTWVLTGMLPVGITFNPTTGAFAGTSTALGAYSLQLQATFPNYLSATTTLTMYVTGGPLTVPQTTLPPAVQGSPYQTTVVASGGLPPYQWSVTGASTLGLSINSQTGVVTGTPQASGSFLLPVTLSDATGQSIRENLSIFVANPLSVATTSLPNGSVGIAYSQAVLPGGGTSPFTWTLATGALPPGLTLSSTGVVSGTPTTAGSFHFSVQVNDAGGRTAIGSLTLSIGVTALSITTSSLPVGQIGAAYSQTLAASGGVAPYTWSKVSGTLPPGLTFNSNGTISGTPLGPLGINTFTIQATDSSPAPALTAQKTFTINIALTLTITTLSLPGGTVGVPYSQTLAGSGGTAPYTWSITAGVLPAGLQLNASTGVISGTPNSPGPNLFTVTLADSTGLTVQQQLNISIGALTITSGASFSAMAGTAFSQTLTANGGATPYTWSISSGTLPAGLQLNAASGVISGTPTAAGTANFTVVVTDAQKTTATAAISIAVNLPQAPPISIGAITGNAATQPSLSLTFGSSFPVDVTGTLTVGFQSSVGGSPTEVQFITPSGASNSVTFSVPAGNTKAIFSNSPVLATGTVAGTITLTASLSVAEGSGSVNITPTPAPTETIVIAPSAPVIQSVTFSNANGALTVTVIGYSTTREMVSGQFTFAPASSSTLAQSTVTVQLGSQFSTWYQSSASNQYGSQFMLTVPFNVSGTSADVASVSVTLTNTKGTSTAAAPQ